MDPGTATLLLEDSRSLPSVQGARARLGVIQGMASMVSGGNMGKTNGFWGASDIWLKKFPNIWFLGNMGKNPRFFLANQ